MDVHLYGPSGPLCGTLRVPGDKSISHRAVLFAAMARGASRLTGVLDSDDVRATLNAVSALGARVEVVGREGHALELVVHGWGDAGPRQPDTVIDCGNSGTTARLLAGIVAGWPVSVTFTGDASLTRRPMARVTEPLRMMGARIETASGGVMPFTVRGGGLHPIDYVSPVASAQVKSAVLLAGTRAVGRTTVREPAASRDHTERMLPAFGIPVSRSAAEYAVSVEGPAIASPCDVTVPHDPSSAAFFVCAAALVPGSRIVLPDVCVNPTRVGFLRVLARMGARVSVELEDSVGGEAVGTITASHDGRLVATTISPEEVPTLVDEIPVLAVVATAAEGVTRFEGVAELTVKEADRLAATKEALTRFGARVRAGDDWLEVAGRAPLTGAAVSSLGDHRLAMAWAVAALAARGESVIQGFEAVDVSYPSFLEDLARLGSSAVAE